MNSEITVRKAVAADVPAIAKLLNFYAAKRVVLARTEDDIRHYLDNFLVAAEGERLIGCMAVRDFGARLFEVRSLAIEPEYQSRGAGRRMVELAMATLRQNYPDEFRLFALTYVPGFFERLGFVKVGRELFPEKIWCDCNNCPKQDNCDEIAMLYTWPLD